MVAKKSQTIGFIGLGAMGLPMAQNVARKSPLEELIVFDLNTQAVEQLLAEFPTKTDKGSNARDVITRAVSA